VPYLTALGYRLFGSAPWVGRGISLVFGLWGVYALYRLVSRAWGPRRGLAAAAVVAVLPGSVLTERSLLADGAMGALLTTSLWMLLEHGRSGRTSHLATATATGMLGCLAKISGGILVIPATYVLAATLGPRLRERRVRRRLIAAALAVALPVVAYYLWAKHLAQTYPPHLFTGAGKFVWAQPIGEWLEERYFLPDFTTIVAIEDPLWGWPFVALAVIGLALPARRVGSFEAPWLFHAWAAAMAVRYLIEAEHLVKDPSNIHLFDPVVAAFAAQTLVTVAGASLPMRGSWRSARSVRVALAAALFTASAVYALARSRDLFASGFEEHVALGRAVAMVAKPGELVISMGLEPITLYHSGRMGWLFPPSEAWSGKPRGVAWDYGARDLALLDDLVTRGAEWLAIPSWNSYLYAPDPAYLAAHYPLLYQGLLQRFELVLELREGMVFRARAGPASIAPPAQG
jgi:4-amino-4-deoxy-L-arabinose transferase-like glycosyltransferase